MSYYCLDCNEHHKVDMFGDYVCPVEYENCSDCGNEISKEESKRNEGFCDICFERNLPEEGVA